MQRRVVHARGGEVAVVPGVVPGGRVVGGDVGGVARDRHRRTEVTSCHPEADSLENIAVAMFWPDVVQRLPV